MIKLAKYNDFLAAVAQHDPTKGSLCVELLAGYCIEQAEIIQLKRKAQQLKRARVKVVYHCLNQVRQIIEQLPVLRFQKATGLDVRKPGGQYTRFKPAKQTILDILAMVYPSFLGLSNRFESLFIEGEPGSFKTTVAHYIAQLSSGEEPVLIQCDHVVKGGLRNELFGTCAGQYSDAVTKKGRIQCVWDAVQQGLRTDPVIIFNEVQNMNLEDVVSLYSLTNPSERSFIDGRTGDVRVFERIRFIYVSTASLDTLSHTLGMPFVSRIGYPRLTPSLFADLAYRDQRAVVEFFIEKAMEAYQKESFFIERGAIDTLLSLGSHLNDYRRLNQIIKTVAAHMCLDERHLRKIQASIVPAGTGVCTTKRGDNTPYRPLTTRDFKEHTIHHEGPEYEKALVFLCHRNKGRYFGLMQVKKLLTYIEINACSGLTEQDKADMFVVLTEGEGDRCAQKSRQKYSNYKKRLSQKFGDGPLIKGCFHVVMSEQDMRCARRWIDKHTGYTQAEKRRWHQAFFAIDDATFGEGSAVMAQVCKTSTMQKDADLERCRHVLQTHQYAYQSWLRALCAAFRVSVYMPALESCVYGRWPYEWEDKRLVKS